MNTHASKTDADEQYDRRQARKRSILTVATAVIAVVAIVPLVLSMVAPAL